MSAKNVFGTKFHPVLGKLFFVCAIASMSLWSGLSSAADQSVQGKDLTNIPIENLLDMEVQSASKFKQIISEAPSAVSVITSVDIKPLAGALWPIFCAACQAHTSQMTAPIAIWVHVVSYVAAITTLDSC
jgi:hypothetical protein